MVQHFRIITLTDILHSSGLTWSYRWLTCYISVVQHCMFIVHWWGPTTDHNTNWHSTFQSRLLSPTQHQPQLQAWTEVCCDHITVSEPFSAVTIYCNVAREEQTIWTWRVAAWVCRGHCTQIFRCMQETAAHAKFNLALCKHWALAERQKTTTTNTFCTQVNNEN